MVPHDDPQPAKNELAVKADVGDLVAPHGHRPACRGKIQSGLDLLVPHGR